MNLRRRGVPADYVNSPADKIGILLMGLFAGLVLVPSVGVEVGSIFVLVLWSVWPVVDGYHHEVVRT